MSPVPAVRFHRSPLLLAQMGVAACALLILPVVPPVEGRMLLLPIASGASASLPRTVLGHDAKLIGMGPVPGSLIVEARRDALTRPLLAIGAVAVATSAGGCSGATA